MPVLSYFLEHMLDMCVVLLGHNASKQKKNALHLEISLAMHQIIQSSTTHQQHGQYYV